MDDPGSRPCIRVRRRDVRLLDEHKEDIRELFCVRLRRKTSPVRPAAPKPSPHLYQQQLGDVSKAPTPVVLFAIEADKCAAVSPAEVAPRLQMFVDSLCAGGGHGSPSESSLAAAAAGDDSSYDSDFEEKEAEHADVSRTASDTLGAEFAEYVSRAPPPPPPPRLSPSPTPTPGAAAGGGLASQQGYAARVEFGLKLGYTEQLVQTALAKLGPTPGQNELLEELIRLGSRVAGDTPSAPGATPAAALNLGLALAEEVAAAADPGAAAAALADALAALAAHDADEAAAPAPAPAPASAPAPQLRHIVIDGSNVAMSHGNKEVFSCRGIRICVDWFRARGHRDITVFVPKWRKEAARPDNPVTEQEILLELERERLLVFTPSKLVGGKRIVCYDDRYVLRLAADTDGVVVSNDNYRDLAQESPEFRKVVEERILMYSFVNDRFMPPDDPLGRAGPTLDAFLAKGASGAGAGAGSGAGAGAAAAAGQRCPYAKKCTYGNKCKFQHPERGSLPQKSVTERLAEHHKQQLQARGQAHAAAAAAAVAAAAAAGIPAAKSLSLPLEGDKAARKTPLSRTRSNAPGLAPPMVDSDHPAGVPKSRSVENIQGGATPYPHSGQALPPQGYGLWGCPESGPHSTAPTWGPPLRSQFFGDQGSHVAVAQRLSDPESNPQEPANMHRKLQRQLTLNPACDPRLQQLRGTPHHRSAARLPSGPDYCWEAPSRPTHPMSQHQHVTRNASAPDSFHPGPSWNPPSATAASANAAAAMAHGRNMFRHGSTSDPQINLCVEPSGDPFDAPPMWPQTPQGTMMWGPPPPTTEEARRVLHYHLSALFPPEQVQQAMRMFPEETSPQKICAAILGMFPGKL